MRRYLLILAGTLCVCLTAEAQIQMRLLPEQEPNDSLNAPQVIATSLTRLQGVVIAPATINPAGDRDYYRFRVDESGVYSVRVDTNRDTVLTLYNSAGEQIATNNYGGNPDIPNRMASGLSLNLSVGEYLAEVRYLFWQGVCRYALRLFPGEQAPDSDSTEPNDSHGQAVELDSFTGGELVSEVGFSSYGGGDVDGYTFKSAAPITGLRIRTVTYVDTILRVTAPDGNVYENDDSNWDVLNGTASEVYIPLGPAGTYFIEVRTFGVWGGYYQLQIVAQLPSEILLQDGRAVFRLRSLMGARDRVPENNADWLYGGADHLFQQGWWYRIEGVHTREYVPSNLNMVAQDQPNSALLAYQEPDGLLLSFRYELHALTAGGAILTCSVLAENLHNSPITLHMFHYFDLDVGGAFINQAEWRDRRIWVLGADNHYIYITPITPYTHWEVTPYPQTLNQLTDSAATTLTGGTLPFEGDFTGAFQWQRTLNPSQGAGIQVHYALDTEVSPPRGDVNGDGCINDTDLLAVLFAFGTRGTFLPEDVELNGVVDDGDLLLVLFNFGVGC